MMNEIASPDIYKNIVPHFCDVTSIEDIEERFVLASKIIMLKCDLVREGHDPWQVTALELYLYNKVWPDPSTHGSKKHGAGEQLLHGCWYVHQRGRGWRAPQRSGLDITCGNVLPEVYAGLLIRSIGGKDGPAIALQTIVRGKYKFKEKDRWDGQKEELFLSSINGQSVFSSPLKLVPRKIQRDGSLWIGPRIFKSKLSKPPSPFGDHPLRIATWKMDGTMKEM